jgi:hypothetical protein
MQQPHRLQNFDGKQLLKLVSSRKESQKQITESKEYTDSEVTEIT